MVAPLTRKLPKDFLWGFATGMSPFLVRAKRKERRGSDVRASVPSMRPVVGNLMVFFHSLVSN